MEIIRTVNGQEMKFMLTSDEMAAVYHEQTFNYLCEDVVFTLNDIYNTFEDCRKNNFENNINFHLSEIEMIYSKDKAPALMSFFSTHGTNDLDFLKSITDTVTRTVIEWNFDKSYAIQAAIRDAVDEFVERYAAQARDVAEEENADLRSRN